MCRPFPERCVRRRVLPVSLAHVSPGCQHLPRRRRTSNSTSASGQSVLIGEDIWALLQAKQKKTRTLRFKFLDCSRECARDHMSAARKASGALWGRAFLAVWVHVSPARFSLHHALACSSLGLLERILFILRRQGDRRQARPAAATACVSFAGLTPMLVSCGWRSLWYRLRLR